MFIRVLALDVHAKIYCPYLPCFLHLSFGVIKTCPEPQHVVNGLDCSMGGTRTWFAIRTAPCLQARKERREKREVQFRSRITGPQGREGDLKPAGPGNSGHNPLQLDLDVRIKALQDKQEQAKSGAKGRE